MLAENQIPRLFLVPRLKAAPTVKHVASAWLPTRYGQFEISGYRSLTSAEEFVCIHKGELLESVPTLVRVHSQCMTGDVFGSTKCDCGLQLERAMAMIAEEGCGVIVYQLQEGRGIGILNKIRAYALQDQGADTIEANVQLGLEIDPRDYTQCVEILRDLGLKRVRVMSNNPLKLKAIRSGGLEIVERVSLDIEPANESAFYLLTKKNRMGHLIDMSGRPSG
jgi:3,4-dihydroxy 2-butanone 4-phosphate synthase/GTP cyclohydrolase II